MRVESAVTLVTKKNRRDYHDWAKIYQSVGNEMQLIKPVMKKKRIFKSTSEA